MEMKTALSFLGFASIVFALLLTLTVKKSLSRRIISTLALAKLAQGTAFLLLFGRDEIPDVLSKNLGNSLLFAGFALECGAAWLFAGRAHWKQVVLPVLAISVLGVNGLIFAGSSGSTLVGSASFAVAILMTLCAMAFLMGKHKRSSLSLTIGVVDIFVAMANVARGMTALSSQELSLLSPGLVQDLAVGSLFLFIFSNGFGFLLLIKEEDDRHIRESEARFHSIFNAMGEIVVLHELISDSAGRPIDYRILEVNPAFSSYTGIPHEQAVGRLASQVYGTDNPPYLDVYARVAQTGEPVQFETYYAQMQKHFRISVVSPAAGRFATLSMDVTESVRQEQEIKLLNRLYRVLSRVSQAVVRATSSESFLQDSCRVIVEEGGFLLAWIGCVDLSTQRVVPAAAWGRISEYVHTINVYADDRPEGRGPTGTCIRERRSVVYNDFLRDPLALPWRERAAGFGIHAAAAFPIESAGRVWGALTIYSGTMGFFSDQDRKLLEKVAGDIGFALDNLERERQRLQAEQSLRESEEKYRKLFENAPVGIFRTSSLGQVLSINSAMARMLGLKSQEEAMERYSNLGAQLYVDPERREQFLRLLQQDGHVENFEYEARTADGRTVWLSMNARLDSVSADGLLVIEGFASDVTERKRTEEERELLQTQLYQAQKMESVGRLAGGVAHDFNNMLGIILGHAELALEEIDPAQSAYNDLQEILKAADRSANLIRQLLAFARKQTISPKVVDINENVESMLKMVRRLIGEDIDLVWKPGPDIWPVIVDPTQIDQILANLCVNARDAIAGVGEVSIRTENVVFDDVHCREHGGARPGEYVLLAVADNGGGMEKEVLEKLFEPFFTTKEVGKGTGLGLATVYGIVKQNKGFIDVESEPGRGTTFRIHLPRARGFDSKEHPPPSPSENLKGIETVLMVEDEEPILELGRRTLERHGYRVLTARNPAEALDLVRDYPERIDLLVTDIIMPGMNGKELAEKMSALRAGLRAVFMSGYTGDVILQQGFVDEGVHFLQKPFSGRTLTEKVREVLDEEVPV